MKAWRITVRGKTTFSWFAYFVTHLFRGSARRFVFGEIPACGLRRNYFVGLVLNGLRNNLLWKHPLPSGLFSVSENLV